MSDEVTELEPIEPTEAADGAEEIDADEAEYQAEMAKLRGEPDEQTEEESDDGLSDDEREYREAMAKARGKEDEEKAAKEKTKKETKAKETQGKIWKFKVYENEVEFDATDEEKVKQAVQKGLGADKVFADSAKIRKQAENFVKALRSDFGTVLQHPSLGIPKESVRKFCEDYLYKEIRQEQMSPEEKAKAAEEEELAQFRRERARREEEDKDRQAEELRSKFRDDWGVKFTEALDAGGVPKTDWTVSRMAQYMRQAIAKGYKHIQPSDVVSHVREDWIAAQKQLFSAMSDDQLLSILGKDMVDRVRKANLAKLGVTGEPQRQEGQRSARIEKESPSRKTYASTDALMRDLRRSA